MHHSSSGHQRRDQDPHGNSSWQYRRSDKHRGRDERDNHRDREMIALQRRYANNGILNNMTVETLKDPSNSKDLNQALEIGQRWKTVLPYAKDFNFEDLRQKRRDRVQSNYGHITDYNGFLVPKVPYPNNMLKNSEIIAANMPKGSAKKVLKRERKERDQQDRNHSQKSGARSNKNDKRRHTMPAPPRQVNDGQQSPFIPINPCHGSGSMSKQPPIQCPIPIHPSKIPKMNSSAMTNHLNYINKVFDSSNWFEDQSALWSNKVPNLPSREGYGFYSISNSNDHKVQNNSSKRQHQFAGSNDNTTEVDGMNSMPSGSDENNGGPPSVKSVYSDASHEIISYTQMPEKKKDSPKSSSLIIKIPIPSKYAFGWDSNCYEKLQCT